MIRKVFALGAFTILSIAAFSSSAPAAEGPDHSSTLACRRKGAVCTKAEQCCSTACYQGGDTVAHCQ